MKDPLSYFVKYKTIVDNTSVDAITKQVDNALSSTLNALGKSAFNVELKDELLKKKIEVINQINEFDELLSEFKDSTANRLKKEESGYLSTSYKIYEDSKDQDDSTYILDRVLFQALIYRDEIDEGFFNRIHYHSSWKHTGMFIRPEYGKYIDKMTSSDPLYVVDESEELLKPIKSHWTKQYQDRLRYRVIDEEKDIIFKNFPLGQFGFIVAMNFFNHKPLDVIRQYLTEIYDLLKPGGVLLFTYNNCDFPIAVQNFEKSLYSYTPGALVEPLTELIGFEILKSFGDPETNVSWLELKKPGKLTSLRGGQCLAKINS